MGVHFICDRKNGVTYAIIERDDYVYIGASRCSSNDNFSRAKGRLIAKGRAEFEERCYTLFEQGKLVNRRLRNDKSDMRGRFKKDAFSNSRLVLIANQLHPWNCHYPLYCVDLGLPVL